MKNTDLEPAQIKRKINALMKRKKEIVSFEKKIEKMRSEIEVLEEELSQCFPPKENFTKEGDLI